MMLVGWLVGWPRDGVTDFLADIYTLFIPFVLCLVAGGSPVNEDRKPHNGDQKPMRMGVFCPKQCVGIIGRLACSCTITVVSEGPRS